MKVRFRGEFTLEEFFQALYDERARFEEKGITHVRSAYLYYTPIDEYGDPVQLTHCTGEPMEGWTTDGPYPCAAKDFKL